MGHITESQRYTIGCMKKAGKSQKEIAHILGKDKSVMSRELKRNCDNRSGAYNSDLAQRKHVARQLNKARKNVFTVAIKEYVAQKLAAKYSPEQIVGTAKREGIVCVSQETIYEHIWKSKFGYER